MSQLDLSLDAPDGTWAKCLKVIRSIVDGIGLKEVAGDLDVSPSYLNHCLNERERNNVQAKWIIYFLRRAPNDELLAVLAAVRACEVVPAKVMTTEERLARLEDALKEELGPGARAAVLERAFGQKGKGR